MAELEDRVTTLETRVDNLTTEVKFGTHLSSTAIREARIATKAHQKNSKLLNALRKTQAEHGQRLDTIDGKLRQMTVGMHTIESLLRQLIEHD